MTDVGARVDALIRAGRLDEAADMCERALMRDPGNADHHCRMAVVRLQQHRSDQSLKHAERAIAIDPAKEWAHRLRAKAFIVKGRRHDAILAAKVAAGLRPEEPMAHETLADAYFMASMLDEAAASIDAALALGPNRVTALKRRARIYLLQGDIDAAETFARQGLESEPEHAPLHYVLGAIAERRGDRAAAEECYQNAGRPDRRSGKRPRGRRRKTVRLLEPIYRRAALKRAEKLPAAARRILEADLSLER